MAQDKIKIRMKSARAAVNKLYRKGEIYEWDRREAMALVRAGEAEIVDDENGMTGERETASTRPGRRGGRRAGRAGARS